MNASGSTTLLLLALLAAVPAGAQETDEATPLDPLATVPDSGGIEVLVLGTFHFRQAPGSDDPSAPEQQEEIRAVVEALSAFRPTKVAVEAVPEDSARLNRWYAAYREGRRELGEGEDQQIGFRLADRADHDRVWPIDYRSSWPMEKVRSYAHRYDSAFIDYWNRSRTRYRAIMDSLHRHATVGETLRRMNTPDFLAQIQAFRMRTLGVDAGGTYVGLDPNLATWRRNMRIFANLLDAAEPGDRIVVVYGAGHVYFFRKFALQHPRMKLVEPGPYLGR